MLTKPPHLPPITSSAAAPPPVAPARLRACGSAAPVGCVSWPFIPTTKPRAPPRRSRSLDPTRFIFDASTLICFWAFICTGDTACTPVRSWSFGMFRLLAVVAPELVGMCICGLHHDAAANRTSAAAGSRWHRLYTPSPGARELPADLIDSRGRGLLQAR